MNYFYISFGTIEDNSRGHQVQTKDTFISLQKKIPSLIGIFRGTSVDQNAKIVQDKNKYLIYFSTRVSDWLEKKLGIVLYKKNVLPQIFVRKVKSILISYPDYKTLFVRIYGVSEGISLIKEMERLKIKKLILELHDLDYEIPIYKYWWEKILRREKYGQLFKLVHQNQHRVYLTTISKNLGYEIKKQFKYNGKIFNIPSAHNFILKKPKKINFNKKNIVIIYTGLNFFKIKGIDYLIQSLCFLGRNFSLKLIGGSKRHRLAFEKKYGDLIASGKLIMVEPQEKNIVLNELLQADLAVIPLPKDGFSKFTSPLKLFEYMSIGLPIIASKIPTMKEILINERNAIFCKPENPEDIADKIKYLITNPRRAKAIGKQAFLDSKEFTYEKRAEKIKQLMLQN